MPNVSVLNVHLHGEPIGTLTRVSGDRTLFAFNETYIADTQRPVLSLGFKDVLGELITEFRPTQTRLLPFFSNLLPEGHLRTYLAQRADLNPAREFFLLWVLGIDLPGAITVTPADGEAWPADSNDGVNERAEDQQHKDALRFSLAGVQLKFSAVNEASGGLTIPAKGVGGSWIVKLPSRQFALVPENEYSMMTLARLIGIDVPTLRLVDLNEINNLPDGLEDLTGQALVIERFDRLKSGEAVHIEDFAQIFGVYPEEKYKKASMRSIASVIASEARQSDVAEFVRRLTFNMLIGNADMHLKNWSVTYPDRRRAALAPAYDLVSTIAYLPDERFALNVSRTKRFDEFTENELSHLAAKALLPEKLVLDTARETVTLFHQHWHAEKGRLPLSTTVIQAIENHFKKIPIAVAGLKAKKS